MAASYKLLVKNARQILQVCDAKELVKRGADMSRLKVLEGEEGFSVLIDRDGLIADIGRTSDVMARHEKDTIDDVIDATGKCVIPGLVDAHTHSVWAGDRVHEFAMKLAGATYMDVHKAGGGIYYTVDHTRSASEDDLYDLLKERLMKMVQSGTTFVEVKSGYGLDLETEVKMLKVIERARRSLPVDISSTYCAHAIPKGQTASEATNDVLHKHLPRLRELMTSGDLKVHNVDVFCEQGVFDVTQSRDILLAGKAMGLNINFHGEELHLLHSAEMGAEIGALTISHLEEVCQDGVKAMARSGHTSALLLPTTAYTLRLPPPPARSLIQEGVPVALGSDFNPNAHCLAMPLVMNLACVTLHLTMAESVVAATLNAAYALGQSDLHGSLEPGKLGNLVILDAPRWEHLIYQLGSHHDLISYVIWHGDVVHRKL